MVSGTYAEEATMAQRPWIRLWTHRLRDSRKFGRMSLEQRGVWMSLLVLAGTHEPEAEWQSRDDLEWSLQLILRTDADDASRWVEWMIGAGLLDVEVGGGAVRVHDWDEHQPAYRGPSDDPDREAQRKRDARNRPDPSGGVRNRPEPSGGVLTDSDSEREGDTESLPPSPLVGSEIDPEDPLDIYYEVTLRYPNSLNLRSWIERIGAAHPPSLFRAALVEEHRADPSPRDLLSRVEIRLNRAADKARRGMDKAPKMEPKAREPRAAVRWRDCDRGSDPVVPGTEAPGRVDRGRSAPTGLGGIGLPAVLGSAGLLGDPRLDGGAVRDVDRGGGPEGGPGRAAGVAAGSAERPLDRTVN